MAIAFDSGNSTTGHVLGSGTSDSWSFTNTAGNFLLVYVMTNNTMSGLTVTYNGVSMTQLGSTLTLGTITSRMFYLVSPATGANTIALSWTGSSYSYSTAASYSGVDTSAPIDSNNSATSASTSSLTGSTTVVGSNCWVVCGSHGNNGQNPVAGSGTTRRSIIAADQYVGILDSNAIVGTGSQSLITTWSPTQGADMIIFSISGGGGGTVSPRKALLGVGK